MKNLVKITIQKKSASSYGSNPMIVKETTKTEFFGDIVCELEVEEDFKNKIIEFGDTVFVQYDKRTKNGFRFEDFEGNIIK